MLPLLLVMVLLLVPATLEAQGQLPQTIAQIRTSSRTGDHGRALRLADSLRNELPDHPNVVLVRAVALAGAGHDAAAADEVRRLLAWDARYAAHALRDSALASIRSRFDAAEIERLADVESRPVARAHVLATIAERDLVAEGTAWDPITRSVLIGSLNLHKVVAVAENGAVSDRVRAGAHGLRSVAGIHVDSMRRVVWVTSNARYDQESDTTSSALYAFDVTSGEFRARYVVPELGRHFLNDVTTAPDGTVYVTDSRAARVWRLKPGAAALEHFTDIGPLAAPNGITISSDGQRLFVADGDHVQVVQLTTGDTWRLAVPDSFNISAIDGLAYAGNALIAHHPLAFWRIARYALDNTHRSVAGRQLIEANTADSRTSTTGDVAGADYVFIGNGQIDRMNARTIDAATMQPIRIYRVALEREPAGLVAVALSARDSVVLLDAQSLERVAALGVRRNPHEIATAPDGSKAYVANAGDTSISVIAPLPSPRVLATWSLPDSIRVHDIAVSDDGATVWAASGAPAVVLELDAATGRVRRRFPIERPGSWMIAAGGPANSLVIGNLEGGATTLLDPVTGQQRVFVGNEGEIDAAATPDRREIWSVNFRTHQLTVFDAATGRVLTRHVAGQETGRVVFPPRADVALIVSGGDSTILAYDLRTRVQIQKLTVPAGPKVIAVSPDGRRAYVTHPELGALTMIDIPALTVLRTIPLPGVPDGVAVLERAR